MKKMKNSKSESEHSLLYTNLRQFALCTAVCFLLTTPVFYLLTKYFYAEDLIDLIEAVNSGQHIPPLDLEEDIIAGMMLQAVLIFVVIALALFITQRFTTRRLWRPFDDTLKKTENFNLAQGDIPTFEGSNIQEFNRLNLSIEQLMRKDKETYRIQKEFTENASHELQTPLAIIRSKLDLLMQEDLNERQMQIVADIDNLTSRMGHLNRNLLLLAKIDNEQYANKEQVDLAALIRDALPLYESLRGGIDLQFADLTPHACCLNANKVLLDCLLKNLIVNAIRHSEGRVVITVDDHLLTVANNAASGQPLDASTLFCRFRTGNDRHKGNGLGLAIVKAICDYHGWSVAYSFVDGHHLFTVDFDSTIK